MKTSLAFIGAGNMASSIIGGLISQGIAAKGIVACDPNQESLNALQDEYGINISKDNAQAGTADVVLIAVKPQVMKPVLNALAPHLSESSLIVSVAAGITAAQISQWLGREQAIVRCMPNTPALVKVGACGLYANSEVSQDQRSMVETLLSGIGISQWVKQESLIDVVTATSGSGPAYYFLMMEAMIDSAMSLGLDRDTANTLVLQTALGAATLAKESDCDVAELRRRVTSPKGTTESAINTFIDQGLIKLVDNAMRAANDRSIALSKELGE